MLDEQERLGVLAYTCNRSARQADWNRVAVIASMDWWVTSKLVTPCLKQKQKTTEMEKIEFLRWNLLKF